MVKVRERGVPRRGTRPVMAPGARGRTTSHHRAPNMVVETRARGRGADSPPRRGMSAAPPCQSGSGRLARPGGRKQVLGRLIIYLPVEPASQIRQLSWGSARRVRLVVVGLSILSPCTYRAPSRESGPPYVTNPTVNGSERIGPATRGELASDLDSSAAPKGSQGPGVALQDGQPSIGRVAGVEGRGP
jgi:hypothetical protein